MELHNLTLIERETRLTFLSNVVINWVDKDPKLVPQSLIRNLTQEDLDTFFDSGWVLSGLAHLTATNRLHGIALAYRPFFLAGLVTPNPEGPLKHWVIDEELKAKAYLGPSPRDEAYLLYRESLLAQTAFTYYQAVGHFLGPVVKDRVRIYYVENQLEYQELPYYENSYMALERLLREEGTPLIVPGHRSTITGRYR